MATISSITALNSAGRMPKQSRWRCKVKTKVKTEELSEELSEEPPGGGEETPPPHRVPGGASRPSTGLETLRAAIACEVEMPEEQPPGQPGLSEEHSGPGGGHRRHL